MASVDDTPSGTESRPVDRRVRRTQKAIRDAFISLVLERGYDHVLIEDIAQRADIGRATFYAHYSDKDNLFAQLFAELSAELAERVAEVRGSPDVLRTYLVRMLFEDARANRDLFRICLSGAGNGRARASYQSAVAGATRRVYAERVKAAPYEQQLPIEMMADVFAGAHVAVLERWLEDENPVSVEEIAGQFMRATAYGLLWGSGVLSDKHMPKLTELLEPSA